MSSGFQVQPLKPFSDDPIPSFRAILNIHHNL
jgi:hypothetical protein